MNRAIRIDYDGETAYITCHTDGEPDELFWVWELGTEDLINYFIESDSIVKAIRYHKLALFLADMYINDSSNYEKSDDYMSGLGPVCGCWYAPLLMEQIERSMA